MLERYACRARLESRCSDRVPSLGRDRAHLDDAPRDARRASLHPRDSGKLSPVACSHRVPSRDAVKRWLIGAPREARCALRFPGKNPVGANNEKRGQEAAAPAGPPQEAARGGTQETPGPVRVKTSTADSLPRKWHMTMAVFPPSQGPEYQEAALPEIRPRSGESMALAGTVLQRARV
ncbi:hypothetical protein NDU88_006515 [Pleurodeles waltl]|uniref:Uncharacterized protein n=1 Tax=Pleurodeles waltl TaxID=8319 RepID=A0AAV7QLZ2_PLEWA|nr:hypothetical protein NDU88_006515 [Pleurodeles waltl]